MGKAWAMDLPTALLAKSPYAYLTGLNNSADTHISKNYTVAMKWPDLWQPAMDNELAMMMDRGIFKLVNAGAVLKGKNIMGCQ